MLVALQKRSVTLSASSYVPAQTIKGKVTQLYDGINEGKRGGNLTTANMTMEVTSSDGKAVIVRPERVVPPAANVSNVYVSVLTVPKLHESRLSYQLMTWTQSFNPRQVGRVCFTQCICCV